MSNRTKRLGIFRYCSPAATKLLNVSEAVYLCPICGRGYLEQAAITGELTLEDVPPRSIGGKGLLLTCSDCNSNAGCNIDFHIKNHIDLNTFSKIVLGKAKNEKAFGDILINGQSFPITIERTDDSTEIRLLGSSNDPEKVRWLKQYMSDISDSGNWNGFKFNISKTVKFDLRHMKIAFLKSGFLLVTALLGYMYAFNEKLAVVREQIRNPEKDLLGTTFWVESAKDQLVIKRRILAVSEPLPMLLVTFDNGAVILPDFSSPPDLYELMSNKWERGWAVNFTGKAFKWPDKAVMALDNQLLNKI